MSIGIDEAPVMFVKKPYGYKVLVGSDNIESFFGGVKSQDTQNTNNFNVGGGCQLNNIFGNSCSK